MFIYIYLLYPISCGHQIQKDVSTSESESGTDCHSGKSGEIAKVIYVSL